jgi:hypothetical protein
MSADKKPPCTHLLTNEPVVPAAEAKVNLAASGVQSIAHLSVLGKCEHMVLENSSCHGNNKRMRHYNKQHWTCVALQLSSFCRWNIPRNNNNEEENPA